MWLGWNYTPLCSPQLLRHFLRGPRLILPRLGRFIEWLHCNSYMVECPMAQITHGYYALKGCPLQCNKRCYCTYEWLPSCSMFVFYFLFQSYQIHVHAFYWVRSNNQSISLFHPVSMRLSLPTVTSFTRISWEESSFYIQSLNSVSFHLYPAFFLSLQWPELNVAKPSSLTECLLFFSVCLCTQRGSCWLDVSYQIVGWIEMKVDPGHLWASRPWSCGDAARC